MRTLEEILQMNLLLNTHDFHLEKIFFLDKKQNIIMDGFFTKIIFSNDFVTMNGLYFDFPVKITGTNKINSNLNILHFHCENKDFLQNLYLIEKRLLEYYMHFYGIHKSPSYNLKTQLQCGSVKFYKEEVSTENSRPPLFYIKISGIWENHYDVGITYKIIEY
jgi:hypothetical protein